MKLPFFTCRIAAVTVAILVQAGAQEHPVRNRGTVAIPQTYCWSFEPSAISKTGESCADYDFWYEAVNAKLRYIVPSEDSTMAIVGYSSVGYSGCKNARLSNKRIDFKDLPKGTFLCATDYGGLYTEFSVNDLRPERDGTLTLELSFTTWEP